MSRVVAEAAARTQKRNSLSGVTRATPSSEPSRSSSSDTLIPLMVVESSVGGSGGSEKLPRLSRTFSSCDIVYTRPEVGEPAARFARKIAKCEHQYHSHETLPTEDGASADAKPRPLSRTQSEHKEMEEVKGAPTLSKWVVIQSKAAALAQAKKDKRRAQIVANVTKRLYKKKVDTPPDTATNSPQPKEEEDDEEPEELKICSRARASLLELTRKALMANKRRREAETQTEFCGHVIRMKEVGVATDSCGSMDEVYRRWGYHYKNGSARSWNYFTDSVIVTEHRFIRPSEEEFSDDSLDSNPDLNVKIQVEGLNKKEKPCVWKVVSITSGQMFNKSLRPDTVCYKSASVLNEETPKHEIEEKLTKKEKGTEAVNKARGSVDECNCKAAVKELHVMVRKLQQSVEELHKRSTPACLVQVCSGRVAQCPRVCDQVVVQTGPGLCDKCQRVCDQVVVETGPDVCDQVMVETRPGVCDKCKQEMRARWLDITNEGRDHTDTVEQKAEKTDLDNVVIGKLTLNQIRDFLNRWRNKCKVERKPVLLDGRNNTNSKTSNNYNIIFSKEHNELIVVQQPHENQCDKNKPKPQNSSTRNRNRGDSIKCGETQSKNVHKLISLENQQENVLKPSDITKSNRYLHFEYLPRFMEFVRNSIQHIPKSQLPSFYIEIFRSFIETQNTIPKWRNPNGIISSPRKHQLNVHKEAPLTEHFKPLMIPSNEESEIKTIDKNEILNDFEEFADNEEFLLPRTTPQLLNDDTNNKTVNTLLDTNFEHWMDIKYLILGDKFNTSPFSSTNTDPVKPRQFKKKSVTWKDTCGCGELVQVRSLSPVGTEENATWRAYYEKSDMTCSNPTEATAHTTSEEENKKGDELLDAVVHLKPLKGYDRHLPWNNFTERKPFDLLSSPPRKRSKPDFHWHKQSTHEDNKMYEHQEVSCGWRQGERTSLSDKHSLSTFEYKNCMARICGKFSSRSKFYHEKHKEISQILDRRKRSQNCDENKFSSRVWNQPVDSNFLGQRNRLQTPPWRQTYIFAGENLCYKKSKEFDTKRQSSINNINLLTENWSGSKRNNCSKNDQSKTNSNIDCCIFKSDLKTAKHICSIACKYSMYHSWQTRYSTLNSLETTTKEFSDECTPLESNDLYYKHKPIAVLDCNKNLVYSCCNTNASECKHQESTSPEMHQSELRPKSSSVELVKQHRSPSKYMRQLLAIRRQIVSAQLDTQT